MCNSLYKIKAYKVQGKTLDVSQNNIGACYKSLDIFMSLISAKEKNQQSLHSHFHESFMLHGRFES